MVYQITDEDLIIVHGGHSSPGTVTTKETRDGNTRVVSATFNRGQANMGHQRHYPIFKTEDGVEMISLNGQTLQPITTLGSENTRREKVQRG